MKEITVGKLLNDTKQSLKVKDINEILGVDISDVKYNYDMVLQLNDEQYNKLGLK